MVDDTGTATEIAETAGKSESEIVFADNEGEGQMKDFGDTQDTLRSIESIAMASLAKDRGTQTAIPEQKSSDEETMVTPSASSHDRETTVQSRISLTGLKHINEFLTKELDTMHDDSELADETVLAEINTLEPIAESLAIE